MQQVGSHTGLLFSLYLPWYNVSMSRQIVILAAGKGTRMGVDIPKVLLPLGNSAVITRLLDEIKNLPQDTAPIIVVGFMKELVKETLGSEYIYAEQFDQKGTAHAVLSAKPVVTAENFVVLNGDMPFTSRKSLEQLSELHASNAAKLSMFTCALPNFEDEYHHFIGFGRIIRDSSGMIEKIQEYKDCTEEQKQITEVNTGIYMFNSKWVWQKLEQIGSDNAQHEFYLTDIVELAIADGQRIQSLAINPKEVYGINTGDDLTHARHLVDVWKP
jgi:bifunctional N-acetylglucosamine-1-phosphate-uridyltransferase/glucosamine-1-phosphate-acetyltransferase GlmU-like protein